MHNFFFIMSIVLGVIMFLPLYRILRGPTLFDRLAGLSLVSTKTVVLLILIGVLNNRVDLYIDIALAYALIGFVGPLVLAKYCEMGRWEKS